jgi:hypothetical protein
MKRAALCISGQPRFFEKGYETLKKNLFDANPDWEFDVFCHGWFNPEKIGEPYDCSYWNRGKSDIVQLDTLQKISELYKPISMEFSPEPIIKLTKPPEFYRPYLTDASVEITMSMFQSIFHSFSLALDHYGNAGTYNRCDLMIRTRYDINLQDPINLNNYKNNHVWYSPILDNPKINYPCDFLNFGDPASMLFYFTVFLNFDKLVSQGTKICGEKMIRKQLENADIPLQVADPIVKLHVFRS